MRTRSTLAKYIFERDGNAHAAVAGSGDDAHARKSEMRWVKRNAWNVNWGRHELRAVQLWVLAPADGVAKRVTGPLTGNNPGGLLSQGDWS